MVERVNNLTNTGEIIRLISADKDVFFVNKDVVCVSKFLQKALNGEFAEAQPQLVTKGNEITLNITSEILEVCLKYMHYQVIYRDLPVTARPTFHIEPPIAHNVLKAAMFLEC